MTASVEELSLEALDTMTAWQLHVTSADEGDLDAEAAVRRSPLGHLYTGVQWEVVDHNYPGCQLVDGAQGLVVVRQAGQYGTKLYFVVTVDMPWRMRSASSVFIANPQAVQAHAEGYVVDWLEPPLVKVSCAADVGRWVRAQQLRDAA